MIDFFDDMNRSDKVIAFFVTLFLVAGLVEKYCNHGLEAMIILLIEIIIYISIGMVIGMLS